MQNEKLMAKIAIFICCLMMIGTMILFGQENIMYLIWLIVVAGFIFLLFSVFHLCEKFGEKYIFKTKDEQEERKKLIQTLNKSSEYSIRYFEKKEGLDYNEAQKMIDTDRQHIKENIFLFAIIQKVGIVFLLAIVIGGVVNCIMSLKGQDDFYFGFFVGLSFAIAAYSMMFIRFITRIFIGYKKDHEKDIK